MDKQSKQFREQFRLLVRNLGLLNKNAHQISSVNLTLTQCHAMIEIGRSRNMNLKELAKTLMLDMSTTSRTVDSLVKKKVITREQSQLDRRNIEISLTNLGQELYNQTEQTMNEQYSHIFNYIPVNKQDQIIESLDLILNALEKNK